MTKQTEEPRREESQHERWTARAALWRERPPRRSATSHATSELMLAALSPLHHGMRVLDVACGMGEPGITIASGIASYGGHVLATDLVQDMIDMARHNAAERGVTNVSFQLANAEDLPFPDQSFDAVTCRNAIMLLPDAPKALREMRRVLTVGGRLIALISGPPERSARERPLEVVRRYISTPPVPSGAPGRFRFSGPGELAEQLRLAGFRDVSDAVHTLPVEWIGTAEERWETALRNSRRMTRAFAELSQEKRQALTAEVVEAFRAEEQRGTSATAAFILATGIH